MSRVAITGLGMVTPIGTGIEAVTSALKAGSTGISIPEPLDNEWIEELGEGWPAGIVTDFVAREYIKPMQLRRIDRPGRMAIAAGRMALDDAGISPENTDPERIAIVMGTGGAGTQTTGAFLEVMVGQGPDAANPMLFPNTVTNAAAGQMAIHLDARGPSTTFAQKGTAGEQAIAYGIDLIRGGRADVVLAGGVDELNPFLTHGYARIGALSWDGCRPFAADRDGFTLGEGAVFCVLENPERRGVAPSGQYVEPFAGPSVTLSDSPIRFPNDPEALQQVLESCLAMHEADRDQIGWVSCGANGTDLDRVESIALRGLLLDKPVPVMSFAGQIGSPMAGGAFRLAAAAIALREGFVPATVGLTDAAVDCKGLAHVSNCIENSGAELVLHVGVADGGHVLPFLLRKVIA